MNLCILIICVFLSTTQAAEIGVTIFHTNDLHSHFEGVKHPVLSDEGRGHQIRGGYSRLVSMIETIKNEKVKNEEIVFGVDAGDFFAGTIFSAIGPQIESPEFPEYEFLHKNEFTAITLGNHEFDAGNLGLETMLRKIVSTQKFTPLLATNLYLKENSKLSPFVGQDKLIKQYLIREFQSKDEKLKVGFLGILGPDGCLVSRATRGDVQFIGFDDSRSKAQWNDLIKLLQENIDELRKLHSVDLVVLTMHGGGDESDRLAKDLKGLNVIIAGHTHKEEFRRVNEVYITQTGSYGESLGLLEFTYDSTSKELKLKDQNKRPLIPITEEISENLVWKSKISEWKDRAYEIMGHKKGEANNFVFTPNRDYQRARELFNPMGELVTLAMREELNKKYNLNLDVYFTSMGLVRTSFFKGVPYNESDIFEAVSIGFDQSMRPGTDIVSFYLTSKELVTLINFLEIYSHFSNSFAPAISPNLSFKVRSWGLPFINRIHDILLDSKPLPQDRLIHVATNSFVFSNIETVEKLSYGIVELSPKDKEGKKIKDLQFHSKEYIHLIDYLRSLSGKL